MRPISWTCVLACIFSLVGDVLDLAAYGVYKQKTNSSSSYQEWERLDPTSIQEDWDLRRSLQALELVASCFDAISWIILCVPLLQVSAYLSMGGTHLVGLHVFIAVLTITAAITEFVGDILFIGAVTTMEWISSELNLDFWAKATDPPVLLLSANPDKIGWRSLEVSFLSIQGMLLWIDAIEWIFISVILLLLFLSIQRQRQEPPILSLAFGAFGLFLSLLAVIEFCSGVLRLQAWQQYTRIFYGIAVVTRLLIWPVWYIWLGFQLGAVTAASPTSSSISKLEGHEQNAPPDTNDHDPNGSEKDTSIPPVADQNEPVFT